MQWRNLDCGCEGRGSHPRSTTNPTRHSYLWFSVCGRKETWQMCDNNLYPDGHHSLIQRPLCPNPGCSLITEHLSPPSAIGEPGTSVGPVCLVGGGCCARTGSESTGPAPWEGISSVRPLSGDWGGCLRGRPVSALETSPPSVHQARRDVETAQETWDRLRRRGVPTGSREG